MGGSSKKVTVGYKYYLGAHMVLGHGPFDKITQIEVDNRLAWSGSAEGGTINISASGLFGGDSREGGVSGNVDIMMGEDTQTRNTYLQSVLGDAIPAFRGVVSAVLRQVYVGNNPYLKPWSFRAQRIFATDQSEQWYPDKAAIDETYVGPSAQLDVSTWKYINEPLGTNNDYSSPDFDDSAWSDMRLPLGDQINNQAGIYGFRSTPNLVVSLNTETWLRRTIELDALPSSVSFDSWVDNGVEVYINGVLVIDDYDTFGHRLTTTIIGSYFNIGTNYLAIKSYDDVSQTPGVDRYYFDLKWFSTHSDMNPAHILRECLTDSVWGLGYQDADIDDTAFTYAADVLFDEKMGISLLWDRQKTLQDFIQDILRHIDGQLFIDRFTGLFVLYLIRDDYSESDLLVLDQTNTNDLTRPQRPALGDLTNSVTVVFWDFKTGEDGSTLVQDHALARQQDAVVSTKRQYPGFSNMRIANKAALRDLTALSTPILTITIMATREAASLHIGQPFILDRPDAGINNLVMRCQEIYFGNGRTNAIKIIAAQDVFAFPVVAASATIPNDFVPPNTTALPSVPRVLIEEPYYELVQELGQVQVDENLDSFPQVGNLLAAGGRQGNEINGTLYIDAGAGFVDSSPLDFVPYVYIDSLGISFLDSLIDASAGVDIEELEVGDIGQIDDELVVVQAIASDLSSITIGRGVLDTVPDEHMGGSALLFWGAGAASDDVEYTSGESVDSKITTATGSDELALADAPIDSLTFESRAIRPYPPGNLQINGQAYPELITGIATISWSHRDRLQQTSGTIYDTKQGDIGPEPGVSYNLYLIDETDTLVRTVNTTATSYEWTTEESDSGLSGRLNTDFRVVLESTRSGPGSNEFDSYQAHNVIVSRFTSQGDIYFDQVVLLLHCDGTNGSTTFTDSSKYNHTMTALANADISTATPKWGTGAMDLDGDADRVQTLIPMIGTQDFTIEAWVRPRSGGLGDIYGRLFQLGNNAADGGLYIVHRDSSNPMRLLPQVYDSGYQNIFSPASPVAPAGELPNDTWTHFALQRRGVEWSAYVNGIREQFTDTPPTGAESITRLFLTIGDNSTGTESLNALLDDIRITLGVARYSGPTIAVPTAPFDDFGPTSLDFDVFWDDVVALLHFDGTNGSTTFTDEKGHTFAAMGDAAITTAEFEFGGASGEFDGTGDYLESAWSTDWEFSATEATFEGWFYPTSTKSVATLIGTRETAAPDHGFQIDCLNGASIRVWAWNSAGSQVINFNSTDGVTANQWNSFAVTRKISGEWEIFVNGVSKAIATESGAFEDSGYRLGIGVDYSGTGAGSYWQGYLDEFRITKGVVRYYKDYTPTGPFPAVGPGSGS